MKKSSIIVLFAVYFQTISGYSSGAPTSACDSMSPFGTAMTAASAQAISSPYILNVSLTSVNAGDMILGLMLSIHPSRYY